MESIGQRMRWAQQRACWPCRCRDNSGKDDGKARPVIVMAQVDVWRWSNTSACRHIGKAGPDL
jgi:hypothetical protein